MTQYVGIDIGTSRTKAGCYDSATGRLVALRAAPTPVDDHPDGATRDAGAVVDVVRSLLSALVTDPAVRPDAIGGVAVGSVGEEVVLVDARGRVTGPVLAWHADHGRTAKTALGPAEGLEDLDDIFSVFKLAWLAAERPDELAAAVTFTSLADHVAAELGSGEGPADVVLNVSHSSRTGLVDPQTLRLRPEVLAAVGAEHLRPPRLVPSGEVVGTTSADGPLPAGIPLVAGGHDHWCGAFGAGARSAGDVYISAGTSEAQVMLLDRLPGSVPAGVDVGAFVAGDLRYLHRATPSGRVYQAWHAMLYGSTDDAVLWAEVAQAVGGVGTATVDRAGRTVQLAPLPLDATRGQAMASLLKGLAHEAEGTTALLESVAGRSAGRIVVAGVPAASGVWRDIRRGATSRHLDFVTEPEVTVLGVALLAQLGVEGRADLPLGPPTQGAPA